MATVRPLGVLYSGSSMSSAFSDRVPLEFLCRIKATRMAITRPIRYREYATNSACLGKNISANST